MLLRILRRLLRILRRLLRIVLPRLLAWDLSEPGSGLHAGLPDADGIF